MFEIRDMIPEDKGEIISLAKEFYNSDAVDHEVPVQVLEQVFSDALSEDPALRGVTMTEDGYIVGFSYLTVYYACEVGGKTLMLEELFMRDTCRGKGYGSRFFDWMFAEYADVKRFRLEVTSENEKAIHLYKKLGFEMLNYEQMILDRNVTVRS